MTTGAWGSSLELIGRALLNSNRCEVFSSPGADRECAEAISGITMHHLRMREPGNNSMSDIANFLSTREPRVLDFPPGVSVMDDPDCWATELIERHPQVSTLQVMQSNPNGSESDASDIAYLNTKNPEALRAFFEGIRNRQAFHGRLELMDVASNRDTHLGNVAWVEQIYTRQFVDELAKKNPLGFYMKASLWLSSGDHKYSAHCDLADGFLFQLMGEKQVRVWPTPEQFRNQVIFNHADAAGRASSQPMDLVLQPGQILFIPGGAMHEVVAGVSETAVSVSFHMGSPYPLLVLCKKLNRLLGENDIFLSFGMTSEEKSSLFFFEPSSYADRVNGHKHAIPEELAGPLADVLQSRSVHRSEIGALLEKWWQESVASPDYQGPYPAAWTGLD